MEKVQKQVCDIRAGKRMTVAQSNEHLRVGESSAWNAKRAGTLDPTRSHLNFEIGRGGVVKDVDKDMSLPKRISAILAARGIKDPNAGYTDEDLEKPRVGVRTHANIILNGSTETMRHLAFGNQEVNFERGADNSHVTRCKDIERWAVDMYNFVAKKYGEENIAAFVVHLDERNPHVHCTLLPITKSGKLSWTEVMAGKTKYEYAQRMKQLHDELAEVNAKWGLERGESVAKTGAQHKSYTQWLEEQERDHKETIKQQEHTIDKNERQIDSLEDALRKATRKVKAMTTMLQNIERDKVTLEEAMEDARQQYADGSISEKEMEQILDDLREALQKKTAEGEKRMQMLKDAKEEVRELAERQHELDEQNAALERMINKKAPEVEMAALREIDSTLWREACKTIAKEFEALEAFVGKLTPQQQEEFHSIIDGSFIEDIAQRGVSIAAVSCCLFLGYVEDATGHAQECGGGGGSPSGGWGRKDDEDDEAYKRRCCIMGRMMMQPVGRKLKR